jgi:hypothetical protein
VSSGQIIRPNKFAHVLWHLKPFSDGGSGLDMAPSCQVQPLTSFFQLRLPLTLPQTLKVPKLAHMRFQQISHEITISTCSGTLDRSSPAVRGSIWPGRARCCPLHAFATPLVHHTTPDPQSTKVGTSEISAGFRPNNSRRGLQQPAKVRDHRGVGKSVPEPQSLTGFGEKIIIIGPRPGGQMVQCEFWSEHQTK